MSTELWNQYLAIRPVAPVEELAAATGWAPGEFRICLEDGWKTAVGVISPDGFWGIRDEAPLPSLAGRRLTHIKSGRRVGTLPFMTDADCMEIAELLQPAFERDDFDAAQELLEAWELDHQAEKGAGVLATLVVGAVVLSIGAGPKRPSDDVLKQIPTLGSLFKLEEDDP